MAAAFGCPLPTCHIVSGGAFGPRADGFHDGADLKALVNTPVRAPLDGTLLAPTTQAAGGLMVTIDHGGGLQTHYAHLAGVIRDPGPIRKGQSFARSGRSGRVTGPHLHFAVTVNGRAVDPAPYLSGAAVASAQPAIVPRNADGTCPAGYLPSEEVNAVYQRELLGGLPIVGGFTGLLPANVYPPGVCVNRDQAAAAAFAAADAVPQGGDLVAGAVAAALTVLLPLIALGAAALLGYRGLRDLLTS